MEKLYNDIIINGIFGEIIKVKKSEALSATVIMVYVAIDTMAFLSMQKDKIKNDSKDFISWINKYLKTDSSQPYQYDGKDMWSARCAKLHSYSSYSDYAKKNNCKLYGYHDGPDHMYALEESKSLVLISISKLVRDFGDALITFLKDASTNSDLKNRMDQRIEKVCQQFEID